MFSGFSVSACIIFYFAFEHQNDGCDKQQSMCFKLEDVVLKIFTRHATAQKKGSFPLRIPSVNVTKSVGN